jgi:hypothetical protein
MNIYGSVGDIKMFQKALFCDILISNMAFTFLIV